MEDAERLESAKSTQSAERLESTESTQSAERLESAESTQNIERLESAERLENAESTERLENAESTQSTERLENAERIQSIERLESAERTDQKEQKEQREHKSQRQQHKGEPDEITADDIANYFISPGKYAGDKKLLQDKIQKLDRYLLHPALCNVCEKQEETEAETIRLYDSLCSRCANETLLPAVIRKTLADTQGLSATKHYRESYFNEIIQNANDNTDPQKDGCRKMKVLVFRTGEQYQMSFRYKDKGFLTENIIGFFDTEIHTKSGNLAATGKHGVGIKSLFYFVEELNITSNVMITVSVEKKEEDGQQTIGKIRSSMRRSGSWDGDTVLTIRFSKKSSYDGAYHVEKLTELIDKAIDGSTVDACFFSQDQKELVFDIRGLLFTDKNIGKKQGIKEICFYEASEDRTERLLFTLSCEEHIPVKIQQESRQADGKLTCLARRAKLSLSYHTDRTGSMAGQKQVSESYVLFTLEHDSQNRKEKQEQNFSVAFPEAAALQAGCPRFYETYYIPQHFSVENMENWNLQYNLLVNSQYSDVSRTKLTEDVTQLNSILKQIQEQILQVIRYMTLEAFWEKACPEAYPGMREAVSGIFHQMLSVDFYRKKDNGLAEL